MIIKIVVSLSFLLPFPLHFASGSETDFPAASSH